MSCPSASEDSLLSSDKEDQESGFVTSKERSLSRTCIPPAPQSLPLFCDFNPSHMCWESNLLWTVL